MRVASTGVPRARSKRACTAVFAGEIRFGEPAASPTLAARAELWMAEYSCALRGEVLSALYWAGVVPVPAASREYISSWLIVGRPVPPPEIWLAVSQLCRYVPLVMSVVDSS